MVPPPEACEPPRFRRVLTCRITMNSSLLAATILLSAAALQPARAQTPIREAPASTRIVSIEQPDAQRTRNELSKLFQNYPPNLRNVLALDPSLLSNPSYLATYPALAAFLNAHPEVARNPSFYIGDPPNHRAPEPGARAAEVWNNVLAALAVFIGFSMAIGLLVWLIRTLVDYRRWSRLAKVQTEVHTKLVDRFTANDELLAYIQSPAGSRFLQSAPIHLDGAPRTIGAPVSRILWSLQGGVVLLAAGIGLNFVSAGATEDAAQPLAALGVLAIALGLGFIVSAAISFLLSRRLGLIEPPPTPPRPEWTGV
jgi:hypothetical protein